MPFLTTKARRKLLVWAVILCAIVVYALLDPAEYQWVPKCWFYSLTGYLCPCCGMQRALHALLHLDFPLAFKYNAFLVTLSPLMVLLIVTEHYKAHFPKLNRFFGSKVFIFTMVFLTLLWWVGRNL